MHLNDVVKLALEKNLNIQVQMNQVDMMKARSEQAEGQFDWLLSANVGYSRTMTPGEQVANSGAIQFGDAYDLSTSYGAGISRELRNGISVGASVSATANYTPQAASLPDHQNITKFDVSLTVPLLKGSGTEVTTAQSRIAQINVDASRYDLRNQIAQTLQQVLIAYWTYRAQLDQEALAISSEERSLNLLNSTQKLVNASERPPADLVLLRADYDDKVVAHQAAELSRIAARDTIGRLVGLDVLGINSLGKPLDTYPNPDLLPVSAYPPLSAMSDLALARRPDLKALALHVEAAQCQLQAASNATKPQLDFSMGVEVAKATVGGSHYGFATESGYIQSSPTAFAKLTYSFPLQNRTARGVVAESSAQISEWQAQQRDLQIGVVNGVESALRTLRSTSMQLKTAKESLASYETAVNQEIIKEKHGISTLIDVLNTESRYESAQANYIQIQLAYATALINLRFATGTLLPSSSDDVNAENFSLNTNELMGFGPLGQLSIH